MDSRRTGLRRAALTIAIPIVALAALFPGAVFRGESFWASDLGGFHRPIRSLLLRLAHESGGLPVWNPYLALGQPYAANPHHAVFHPTTALFFLLPFETAFRVQVLLPILVAFAAMVFFLRTMGRSLAAALFGGLCWAFGGAFLSGTILLPIALTLAPMPATLACAIRMVRARDSAGMLRNGAACALLFGLQGLAGEPGSLIITMGLGALALLEVLPARAADPTGPAHGLGSPGERDPGSRESLRRMGRGAALLAAAFALGIGVAGAALVPGAALGARSSRALAGGIPASEAAIWSMPPARLAEVAFPRALGYLDKQWDEDGWYWGASSYPRRGRPFLFSLYGGSLALALAAAGIAGRPKRLAGWIVAGVIGAILALGPAGLLWSAARGVVPLFANVRYPERWFLATSFVVALAGAFGFDALREARTAARRIVVWGLAVFGAAALAASFFVRTSAGEAWVHQALGTPEPVAGNASAALAHDLLLAALVAGAGAVAAALMSRRSVSVERAQSMSSGSLPVEKIEPDPAVRPWDGTPVAPRNGSTAMPARRGRPERHDVLATVGAAALISIAALDLVHAFRPFALTDPPELLGVPPPAFQRLLAQPPSGPIFHYAAYDRTKNPVEDRATPPVPALWGLATTLEEDFDISELAWSRRATVRFFEASVSDPGLVGPLLARRGVAAIVRVRAPSPATADQDASRSGADPGAVDILRPNGSLPFMVCLQSTEVARGEAGWLAAVKRLGPEAARTAVVDPADAPGGVPEHPSPCEVTAVTRTPVRIEADVRGNGPGFSFLAIDQTWDVGWHVHLDGGDTPLLRTDLALSALLVPPGSHRIELTYHDPWIGRGAIVSIASLAACGVLVVLASRRTHTAKR